MNTVGHRTLIIGGLAIVAGTAVELATGSITGNLLELLLGIPLIVGGRHLGQEFAQLLKARQAPPTG